MSTGSRTKAATQSPATKAATKSPATKSPATKAATKAAATKSPATRTATKAATRPKGAAIPTETKVATGHIASAESASFESAPTFSLTADDGTTVSLSDLAGKRVVLYFYPKDDTPGCTRQACAFQENIDAIHARGAVVIGVSRDSQKAHERFKTKYDLDFPLLVDADAAVHKAYGAWGEKTNYGKTTEGALRTTVILDEAGRIVKRFPSVKVDGHASAVLAALDAMKG